MLIKLKYMIMSRDQDAGRSHGIKIDNTGGKKFFFLVPWFLGLFLGLFGR